MSEVIETAEILFQMQFQLHQQPNEEAPMVIEQTTVLPTPEPEQKLVNLVNLNADTTYLKGEDECTPLTPSTLRSNLKNHVHDCPTILVLKSKNGSEGYRKVGRLYEVRKTGNSFEIVRPISSDFCLRRRAPFSWYLLFYIFCCLRNKPTMPFFTGFSTQSNS